MEYDVVDKAEKAVLSLEKDRRGNILLTKNQIRKFLSAVNTVKNKVIAEQMKKKDNDTLSAEMAAEVKFLKVTIMYQAGRERSVKDFLNRTELEKIISDIGNDRNKFDNFCKYVEALVAFHKFHGGRD